MFLLRVLGPVVVIWGGRGGPYGTPFGVRVVVVGFPRGGARASLDPELIDVIPVGIGGGAEC